jgi:DNA-binding NarL/FixJ family response regulator
MTGPRTVKLSLRAPDPLTWAGIVTLLKTTSDVDLLWSGDRADADVWLVAAARLTVDVVADLRSSAEEFGTPVVLVTDQLSEEEFLVALDCGVVAVLPTTLVTAERLLHCVRSAAEGGGVIPPDLLGVLLGHLVRLRQAALEPREVDVVRLMADGHDNAEIAARLHCSERLVKKVVSAIFRRLGLRNRTHVVAYAIRTGIV